MKMGIDTIHCQMPEECFVSANISLFLLTLRIDFGTQTQSLVRHCLLDIVGGSVAVNQKSMINRLTNGLRFDIHCCRLVIRMNANNENGRFHLFFVESTAPSHKRANQRGTQLHKNGPKLDKWIRGTLSK